MSGDHRPPILPADGEALAALVEAAGGLLMPSETDAPFTPVHWAGAWPLSPERVRARLGLPPATPVERRPVARLFAALTRVYDPGDAAAEARAARFAALRREVEGRLHDPAVYRVGSIKIDVLILGRAPSGAAIGLRTTVVET